MLPFVPGETRSFGFRLTAPPEVQQKATPDLDGDVAIVFTQSKAPLPKPRRRRLRAVAGGFARGGRAPPQAPLPRRRSATASTAAASTAGALIAAARTRA